MLAFLIAVGFVVSVIREPFLDAILANPPLNIGILAVLALGVLYTLGQTLNLRPEIKWINGFRHIETGGRALRTPTILAPMARLLEGDFGGGYGLSPTLMRTILDSIGSRLDESRDISRYMVGLLIFLGLLGTFWGLLQTVNAVGDTIRQLSVGASPIEDSFEELRAGLEAPLGGMGTAFSSSLIGLAGSLVLGFLDLQMAQAQNRFYNDVEEWLSAGAQLDGAGGIFDYSLHNEFDSASSNYSMGDGPGGVDNLLTTLSRLDQYMKTEQKLMVKVAESQAKLAPLLERFSNPKGVSTQDQYTETICGHLRNLNTCLQRLLEENAKGQDKMVAELKQEIMTLTQTIRDIAGR
jgi:hypothetical protein